MRLTRRLFICIVSISGLMLQAATLKLAPFYGDNMVFQRDRPIVILGQADANAPVSAAFMGTTAATKADADGRFKITLPAQKVCKEGGTAVLKSAEASVELKNILVGDVWLCSGQSNMEWTLRSVKSFAELDLASANLPLLRRIKFSHETATDPVPYMSMKASAWSVAETNTVQDWTAVGFYFARSIQAKTGIPIGILDCNWGGTRIEPWTPAEMYVDNPEFPKDVETLKNRIAWAKKGQELMQAYTEALKVATDKKAVKKPSAPWSQQSATAIYNAMVDGMTPMAIAGAIWYQGESNAGDPQYARRMELLLKGWRQKWGYEFPFYFVQLAAFQAASEDPANTGWGVVRQLQLNALRTIPRSGMAVAIDIGEGNNIHPQNKFDVGERLALWALRDVYGETKRIVSGPLYKGMKIEGSGVRVQFDADTCEGLMVGSKNGRDPVIAVKGGKVEGFAIQAKDGTWKWADAAIDGETIVVKHPDVKEPVAVRYAYQSNPKANLYNKAGLPASPFTTEK